MIPPDLPLAPPRRMTAARLALWAACVLWLVFGIFESIEGFGIPPHLGWRPIGMMAFLVLNAAAAAIVLSECVVLARPRWAPLRQIIAKVLALALFVVTGVHYLVFVHRHAVSLY